MYYTCQPYGGDNNILPACIILHTYTFGRKVYGRSHMVHLKVWQGRGYGLGVFIRIETEEERNLDKISHVLIGL